MKSFLTRSLSIKVFVVFMALPPANADLIGHGGMVLSVDFSEDGQRVVTASFD